VGIGIPPGREMLSLPYPAGCREMAKVKLSSRQLYNLPRADIHRHLRNILSFKGIQLPGKRRYLRALDLYATTPALSFVDALLAAYAQERPAATVISFDTGFDRVSGLTREEP
jgi:predicted nucleic acid-binding protein